MSQSFRLPIAGLFAAVLVVAPPPARAGAVFDGFLEGMDEGCRQSPAFQAFEQSLVARHTPPIRRGAKIAAPADLAAAIGPAAAVDKGEWVEVSVPLDGTWRGVAVKRFVFSLGKENGIHASCIAGSSIGALAVAPSDSNVIYAGTGETTIRIDVTHGDGVYKSIDAGKTWSHIGLEDTRFIGKVRVHPDNPDIVYVAALGHAFGPNKERGVYKSVDGGKSWEQTLFVSDKAGAVDLTLDANPRIIYATIWEAHRKFWDISSGGEDRS